MPKSSGIEDRTNCYWIHRHIAYKPQLPGTYDVIDRCVPSWQPPGAISGQAVQLLDSLINTLSTPRGAK